MNERNRNWTEQHTHVTIKQHGHKLHVENDQENIDDDQLFQIIIGGKSIFSA